METTKRSPKTRGRRASGAASDRIRAAYVDYLLTNGKQPASVYKFCIDLGIKEESFYSEFGSFDAIEKDIWTSFITKTVTALQSDKAFATFTSRERILSFYYALLEELKNNRSFVLQQIGTFRKPELTPSYLKGFKPVFEDYVSVALHQGKSNGEISTRPYIDKIYPQLFWMHFGFILLYWRDDDSAGFEKTDAAVEKSVNSAFDFAKFLYQSKK